MEPSRREPIPPPTRAEDEAAGRVEHFPGGRTSRPDPLRDWYDGLGVDGIGYARNDPVAIVDGEHAGEGGSVITILAFEPEPLYLVELATDEDARVPRSALRPARRSPSIPGDDAR